MLSERISLIFFNHTRQNIFSVLFTLLSAMNDSQNSNFYRLKITLSLLSSWFKIKIIPGALSYSFREYTKSLLLTLTIFCLYNCSALVNKQRYGVPDIFLGSNKALWIFELKEIIFLRKICDQIKFIIIFACYNVHQLDLLRLGSHF